MIRLTYACIPCRKSWKGGRNIGAIDNTIYGAASITCTACGRPGRCMGRSFKPPRKNSDTQWKKIETGFWKNAKTLGEARQRLKKAQRRCIKCNKQYTLSAEFDGRRLVIICKQCGASN